MKRTAKTAFEGNENSENESQNKYPKTSFLEGVLNIIGVYSYSSQQLAYALMCEDLETVRVITQRDYRPSLTDTQKHLEYQVLVIASKNIEIFKLIVDTYLSEFSEDFLKASYFLLIQKNKISEIFYLFNAKNNMSMLKDYERIDEIKEKEIKFREIFLALKKIDLDPFEIRRVIFFLYNTIIFSDNDELIKILNQISSHPYPVFKKLAKQIFYDETTDIDCIHSIVIQEEMISHARLNHKIVLILKACLELIDLKITPENYPDLFKKETLSKFSHTIGFIATNLVSLNYSHAKISVVFKALQHRLNDPATGLETTLEIVSALIIATDMNKAPLTNKQLKAFIENHQGVTSHSYGPLNKSKNTTKIETLVEQIPQNMFAQIFFNQDGHYILSLESPIKQEVNLSLLIKNANLSQLILSESCMEQLKKYPMFNQDHPSNNYFSGKNTSLELLTDIEKIAFKVYFSKKYVNINKFFRSEPIRAGRAYCIFDNENKDLIAYFLFGCIIHHAINRLPALADEVTKMNQKLKLQDLNSQFCILNRGENLEESDIQQRTSNPYTLPALTSFSRTKEGLKDFNNNSTTQTKLLNPPKTFITNEIEEEILLPQGTQLETFKGPNGLISKIICSPDFDEDNFDVDNALIYAYHNFYSKEYKDQMSAIRIARTEVTRPNHNMTHAYRKSLTIIETIKYFAKFAEDDEFKKFCNKILKDAEFIKYLKIGSIFTVSGRESEISFRDDNAKYENYREASAKNFIEYMKAHHSDAPTILVERLGDAVRYMGNPDFNNDDGSLNTHPDIKERKIRTFLKELLTHSHNLDLPRCRNKDAMESIFDYFEDDSIDSDEQFTALKKLFEFSFKLIESHGGTLQCSMDENKKITPTRLDYKDSYAKTSNSFNSLSNATKTVPRPKFN